MLFRSVDPFFRRTNIRGRCTTCWKIADPVTGEELLVKDSWRSGDRVSEFFHLKEALGISGVVQMVSCVPDRGQTKDLQTSGTIRQRKAGISEWERKRSICFSGIQLAS